MIYAVSDLPTHENLSGESDYDGGNDEHEGIETTKDLLHLHITRLLQLHKDLEYDTDKKMYLASKHQSSNSQHASQSMASKKLNSNGMFLLQMQPLSDPDEHGAGTKKRKNIHIRGARN
ncbi:hypothetical protein C5167_040933 [Papaver somniferum]|uniref:Uncharacterized protein n=1 Tax=Papaver somniferum TaxID=3469 RepID=A0A4Y7IGJ8_PAPSO|nr:hypothetical protein C5167_040933 [Papaver somniferum]